MLCGAIGCVRVRGGCASERGGCSLCVESARSDVEALGDVALLLVERLLLGFHEVVLLDLRASERERERRGSRAESIQSAGPTRRPLHEAHLGIVGKDLKFFEFHDDSGPRTFMRRSRSARRPASVQTALMSAPESSSLAMMKTSRSTCATTRRVHVPNRIWIHTRTQSTALSRRGPWLFLQNSVESPRTSLSLSEGEKKRRTRERVRNVARETKKRWLAFRRIFCKKTPSALRPWPATCGPCGSRKCGASS